MNDSEKAVSHRCYLHEPLSPGSHIVGSAPLQALIKSADNYIEQEHVFLVKEQQKIRFIVDRLGLNSVSEFKPESKVIYFLTGSVKNKVVHFSAMHLYHK